jgi:hypothetical protein
LAVGSGLLLVAVGCKLGPAVESVEAEVSVSVANEYRLPGNYVDWTQQEIAFGERSYYAAPWRSYMDTRDAPSLLNALAINFDYTTAKEYADSVSQALQEIGFKSVRLEVPWLYIDFDVESKLTPDGEATLSTLLAAFKKHSLRPLV